MSSNSRSKKSKTSKLKLKKHPISSHQSTINQYFGGKPVATQSTVTQFFKKQPQDSEECTTLTSGITTGISSASDDAKQCKGQIPSNNNKGYEAPKYDIKSEPNKERTVGAGNPFKKIGLPHCPQPSCKSRVKLEESINNKSASSTKSLSLKIRKRKHRTIVSPEQAKQSKKPCLSLETKYAKVIKKEMNGLSKEDFEVMSGYSGEIQKTISLSDLDEYDYTNNQLGDIDVNLLSIDQSKQNVSAVCEVTTVADKPTHLSQKSVMAKKRSILPNSPTFSPQKHALKYFSPLLDTQSPTKGSSQVMDTSIPLFSTPLECEHVSRKDSCSNQSTKRALFSPSKEKALPVSNSNRNASVTCADKEVYDEFGFEGDVNLSDLLDQSDLLSEWDASITDQSTRLCRYLVLEKVSQMSSDQERPKPEIMLRLFDEKTSVEKICYLRDDWLTTDVEPGDMVQVNAEYDRASSCYKIDNTSQFSNIVVNPDCLISGTSVANSITCVRRAVLAEKFKGQKSGSEAMTIGQLLHEVFQRVLLKRQEFGESLSGERLMSVVKQEIKAVVTSIETLDQLYCLEMSEDDALEKLSEQAPAIVDWCDNYMHQDPVEGKGNIESKTSGSNGESSSCVAITDVLDIEENIWSPRYGLKGKVDVSVSIKERRKVSGSSKNSSLQKNTTTETPRLPLELKTGKMFRRQGTIDHRAQVALYTLMLEDRYIVQPPSGLLFYLKGGHMQGLPSLSHEIRGLINARNHLSRYQSTAGDCMSLPGLLKQKHTCKYCPCIKECMLYHSSIEQGDKVSSGVDDLFSEQVSHLSPNHLKFFNKWYSLIAKEERNSKTKDGRPLWLTDPVEREKEGRCHANLLAKPSESSSPFKRQTQTFFKCNCSSSTDSLLSTNDAVVISRQDGSGWAIAMGSITKPLGNNEIEVLVDKVAPSDSSTLYRIDAAPSYGSGFMAGSLADFCSSDSERDHHLRGLIIDLEAPKFSTKCSPLFEDSNEAGLIISHLNSSQRNAISKVLLAKDYALILGMPGTGKTTTIACLVRVLVALGKSVLVTSYTHSAVDNILLKLKMDEIDFLRLGSLSRVHPSVQMYTPSHLCKGLTTVQSLEQVYLNTPVVATTCLGIKHSLFTRRSFDVCIIDEASQITLPASLGPLRHASAFVLVGDHYQLPPLVQSQQAREGGLDMSLFRYLSEHRPSSLVSLEQQYRMNREIMTLSNKLIYNNHLKCGTEDIASARLPLPHLTIHQSPAHGCAPCENLKSQQWLQEAINPAKPVLFLNTDKCNTAMESIVGDHISNMFEADLMVKITETLLQLGLPAEKIGIITPVRYQQNLIRQKLKLSRPTMQPAIASPCSNSVIDLSLVEVNTIDKYQGRDKECILLSFVRNNLKGNTGPLLKDWRRINVALTRAKHKLLLVGSYNTLKRTPLLQCLLEHLVENQWLFHLSESID